MNLIEQWKRIATRIVRTSPPISRQYFQTTSCIFDTQDRYIPDVLGSYLRPGRTDNEQTSPPDVAPLLHTPRRKILFCLSIICITIAITVAVVVAVILGKYIDYINNNKKKRKKRFYFFFLSLVRKPHQTTTDYYPGSIFVRARFDPILSSITSTLAKNYEREFCTLVN